VEETTQDDFEWVLLLEYLVSGSGVKTLGHTLVGLPGNGGVLYVVTLMKALL
jgi:hypothetical protein